MLFFTFIALPAVVCGLSAALFWLPSRSTGWLIRLDVGLAWFAALATLILVPTDVAAALTQQDPGPLRLYWRAAYWYGFSVQMLVLPLHMEYARRGEFGVKDRLLAAARYNLLYYGVLLAVAVAGLLLLLFSGRLQPANVVGLVIASSNAYGLVGAIFLLGFGLWAVPRALWNSADRQGEQRRVYHKAGLQAERAQAAHRRLSAAVLTVRRASVLFAAHDPLRPLMDVVLGLAGSVGPSFHLDSGVPIPDEAELDVFDRSDLARLRRELKAAMKDWEREHALYLEAVQEHLALEQAVARLESGIDPGAPAVDRLRWLWNKHLHFLAFRLLAALAALCSLAIVVAEATIAWTLPNLSVVSRVLHSAAGSRFATELLCFLFLAYPCACAYYSLYRLGRFAFYRMVPRHTDAYSLCFSALLMCRFAAPLAFNFMAAIAMPEIKGHATPDVTSTVFYAEFGQLMMRQPLIGWQFTTFAPVLLVPWVLLLSSGVFGHLMALFKRGDSLEFEDDWQNDSCAATGRRLLLLESENARNGLPLGLTVEPSAGGGGSSGTASRQAAASGGGGSATTGLLGTLRSAAAAAAAERAAERSGRSWWRRLIGGGGSKDTYGDGSAAGLRLSSESQPARSRLSRPTGTAAGSRGGAGYTSLPSEAPPASRSAHAGAGSSSASSGLPASSPPFAPSTATGAKGMKAARAKYLAGAAAAAPPPQQAQQAQQAQQLGSMGAGEGGRGSGTDGGGARGLN